MFGSVREVLVCGEQRQLVANAELGQDGVNGSDLDACAPTGVADVRCCYVVVSVGLNQRQRSEALDDLGLCLRSREALKKLLQDEASCDDDLVTLKGVFERLNRWLSRFNVTPKRKRPNACIDEAWSCLAGALGLVIEGVVPVELAEEFGNPTLLPSSDELLQRLGDSGLLGAFTAHLHGAFEQGGIDCEVGSHVRLLVRELTHGASLVLAVLKRGEAFELPT